MFEYIREREGNRYTEFRDTDKATNIDSSHTCKLRHNIRHMIRSIQCVRQWKIRIPFEKQRRRQKLEI